MTPEQAIRLRKVRDHMGVMTTNPKLSHDEQEHIKHALSEIAYLLSDLGYPSGYERGATAPRNVWEDFL